MSDRSAPTRSCRGCGRGSPAQITAAGRRRERARRARRCTSSSRSTGEPVGRRHGADEPIDRDVAALRPGRRRRHRPARDRRAPSRATGSRTSSRTTCRTSSSTTRTSPGATRPPRRTARARLRPWIALVVLEEGEFEDGRNVAGRPLPCIDGARRRPRCPPADELWAWAHVHVNRDARRQRRRDRRDRHGRRARRGSSDALRREPGPRLLAHRLPAAARAENAAYHAFLVPMFETGRLAGLGLDPTPARRTPPSRPGSDYAGEPEAASLPVLPPLVLPHRHRRRLRVPRAPAASRSRSTRASARATWTCSEPGAEPARASTTPTSAACCGSAARCACPRRASPTRSWTEVETLRELGRSRTRTRSRRALAAFVNLADDYARARRAGRERRRRGLAPERPGRPRSADHAAAVRPLARADAAPAARRATATPRRPDDNWVHELNLDPRYRVAAGFGTRVVQEQPGGLHGRRLGADRRRARGQPADPRAPSSRSEAAASWYATPAAAARRRRSPERALALTAPVQRARGRRRARPCSTGARRAVVPPALTSAAMRRITRPRGRLVRALPFDARRAARHAAARG